MLRICDRVVVMRAGEIVAERSTADVTEDELFALMIGRNERAEMHPRDREGAEPEPVLEVEGLTRRHAFSDVSLVAGPRAHAWRSSARTAPAGSRSAGRSSAPSLRRRGAAGGAARRCRYWSMTEAVRSGIAYVPSERRVEGMVGGMDAAENLTLVHPGASRTGPFLRRRARAKIAAEWFEQLDVRPRDPALDLARFSGGNQQKVVMAKWLQPTT